MVKSEVDIEGRIDVMERKQRAEVIEGCSLGKNMSSNNDKIIISRRYIAVVDGVSSRNKVDDKTTLSDKIVEFFEYNLSRSKDFDKVLEETSKMTKEYKENNGFENCNKDGFVCGVIDKQERKVYILGDITLRLNDFVYTTYSKIDELKAMYRSYLINRYIKMGYSLDEIEDLDRNKRLETTILGVDQIGVDNGDKNAINNLVVQDMFIGCDSDFGYMVFNGGNHKIEYEVYDLNENDTVILASDGYPDVKGSWKETENELQKLLKEDRMCYKTNKQVRGCYKGNHSFDDRTYIKVIIK